MVLLQPVLFFRVLSVPQPESRVWLWAAILILFLIGASGVRQAEMNSAAPPSEGIPGGAPPFEGIPGGAPPFEGMPGGAPPFEGAPPNMGGEAPAANSPDAADTIITGMVAASGLFFGWFALSFLLSFVSLVRGLPPPFGINLQVAIWASLPFAIMAGVQLLYYSNGGKLGAQGLSGLVKDIQGFDTFAPFLRDVIYSALAQLTLFGLWMLVLVYLGARYALRGGRAAAFFVTLTWAFFAIFAPIVSGTLRAPPLPLPELISLPTDTPPDTP
ncbi:MAG: hypothetical protein DYG88_01645 [Chloroflexi bacterium CFX4]|nr:hypothetical protein [Chloroflexi bacterium CFX4]